MSSKRYLFTSESVTEGHPDKVCDQISDAILDNFLMKDNHSRVAAETTVTTGMALVCGEITADCYVDIPHVVRETIKNIGYIGKESGGFDANTLNMQLSMVTSPALMLLGVVITAVLAILGTLFGQRLLRKHFQKAGIVG